MTVVVPVIARSRRGFFPTLGDESVRLALACVWIEDTVLSANRPPTVPGGRAQSQVRRCFYPRFGCSKLGACRACVPAASCCSKKQAKQRFGLKLQGDFQNRVYQRSSALFFPAVPSLLDGSEKQSYCVRRLFRSRYVCGFCQNNVHH